MDAAARLTHTAAPRLAVVARRLAAPRFAVASIVLLSSAVHLLLAWRRSTPGYFPDEYMYAELGRSLLESGTPLVRGESAQFLPLLYPLLTAPAWLWDDVGIAYRTIQGLNAVAMSLVAIPVFLLARRLRVGDRLAVAAAALAVVLPELLYSSSLLAESLAYPFALAAVAVAVSAVEHPLLRLQFAFLACAGLAAFSRLQLAVLPLCYLIAVVAIGLRERRLRETLREHWLVAGVSLAFVTGGLALALGGTLGLYGSLTSYSIEPVGAAKAIGVNALVLAYAVGWAIVPGALLGLALALARPRTRGELAFGVFALSLLGFLLLQAALVGDVGRVQERYAIYALPLLICMFALYASRGWPSLRAHALLAAVAATAAAIVPLAGYAAGGGSGQSFVLVSLRQLERWLGDVGLASLAFAGAGAILSGIVLFAASMRPRLATVLALATTALAGAAMTAAASSYYQESRATLRAVYLPADPSWVDAAATGPVTLVVAPRSTRADLHTTLFWNRSVQRLVLLAASGRPDPFATPLAAVDGAGRLVGVAGPILADVHGSWLVLRDALRLASGPTKTLWSPAGTPQLQLLMTGRYFSGLLAAEGGIRVWPATAGGKLAGRVELELSNPGDVPMPLRLELPDGRVVERSVEPGATRAIQVPVCGTGVWTAPFSAGAVAIVHGTRVGLRSSEPRFVDDPAAC